MGTMTEPAGPPSGRLWSLLDMERFFAGALSLVVGRLERGWNALNMAALPIPNLPPEWTPAAAWAEVDKTLSDTRAVLLEHGFPDALIRHLDRVVTRCVSHNPAYAIAALQELSASIVDELSSRVYFVVDASETSNIKEPLNRFGMSALKFPTAKSSMASASTCFALDEWDASVFHSMRVLEHGLRWLASQINAGPFPLTLKKDVELEQWGNIIDNIQARINEELEPPRAGQPPRPQKTAARDELLAFYSKAAKEFMYFKEAWRNHVMHNRNVPHDQDTSRSVLNHVTTFMKILGEKV